MTACTFPFSVQMHSFREWAEFPTSWREVNLRPSWAEVPFNFVPSWDEVVSAVDQLIQHDFLCLCFQHIHVLHPCHLLCCLIRRRVCFQQICLQLLYSASSSFANFFQVRKQLLRQNQVIVEDGTMLFEIKCVPFWNTCSIPSAQYRKV